MCLFILFSFSGNWFELGLIAYQLTTLDLWHVGGSSAILVRSERGREICAWLHQMCAYNPSSGSFDTAILHA